MLVSNFYNSLSEHIENLLKSDTQEGVPSLQNSLELAITNFMEAPKYAFKEVLVIYSNMITCDSSNIFDTIESLKDNGIKLFIFYKKICQETQGEFSVVKDSPHFDELIQRNLLPKTCALASDERDVLLIKMGFPKKNITSKPLMCSCHCKLKCVVFECPNCGNYQCDVPSFCKVCNLMLASSAHLTRTSHHNNQVDIFSIAHSTFPNRQNCDIEFLDISNENTNSASQSKIVTCGGCEKKMEMNLESSKFISICPRCTNHFCLDCDIFIHETLLSCPMCD